MKKILIIRFSSIGDIVLTTPVIRSLKAAQPETEIHYLTKSAYADLLTPNPHISAVHVLEKNNWRALMRQLRAEQFDHILDLHHNLRSLRVKLALLRPASSFDKYNLTKFRMVRLKTPGLAAPHIVTRYGETLRPLGLDLDGGGLDFFLPENARHTAQALIAQTGWQGGAPLAVVLGATYATKRWLPEYFAETIESYGKPVILIGGPDARAEAQFIREAVSVPLLDAVGKYSLAEAAALMQGCHAVLTHDTGFMHIAAAFGMKVYSLWGNTVPEFGMTPYRTPHVILETRGLPCRPCSKIGFDQCPQGHFRCMKDLKPAQVLAALRDEAAT